MNQRLVQHAILVPVAQLEHRVQPEAVAQALIAHLVHNLILVRAATRLKQAFQRANLDLRTPLGVVDQEPWTPLGVASLEASV